jgi:hypothetical protein
MDLQRRIDQEIHDQHEKKERRTGRGVASVAFGSVFYDKRHLRTGAMNETHKMDGLVRI